MPITATIIRAPSATPGNTPSETMKGRRARRGVVGAGSRHHRRGQADRDHPARHDAQPVRRKRRSQSSETEPVCQQMVGEKPAHDTDQVPPDHPPCAVLVLVQNEGEGGRPQAREDQGQPGYPRRHARHEHERADMRKIVKGLTFHAKPA